MGTSLLHALDMAFSLATGCWRVVSGVEGLWVGSWRVVQFWCLALRAVTRPTDPWLGYLGP
jgi:hypothetical protein